MASTRGQALLVTASRDWTDEEFMHRRMVQYRRGTILLHGAARGGDTIAARIGKQLGFQVVGHSYFSDMGKAGGPERNALLVRLLCTYRDFGFDAAAEGFPLPTGSGTQDCLQRCYHAALITYELGRLL